MEEIKRLAKPTGIMAVLGICVALTLTIMWRVINLNDVPLSDPSASALSGLTLALCPSSFVMMEVSPHERITGEIAALYIGVILANGLVYGLVTMTLVGIVRLLDRTPTK
jgi:hypothetical protein